MDRRSFFGVVTAAALTPLAASAATSTGGNSFSTIRHQMFDVLHTVAKEQFTTYGKGPMELSYEAVNRVLRAISAKVSEHTGVSVSVNGTMKVWRYHGEFSHTASIFPEGGSEYRMVRTVKGVKVWTETH